MSQRNSKYPWDVWMDGNEHTIQKGKEYTCSTAQIRNYMYSKAVDEGLQVTIHRERHSNGEEFLVFRFRGHSPEQLREITRAAVQKQMAEAEEIRANRQWYEENISDEAIANMVIKPRPVVEE